MHLFNPTNLIKSDIPLMKIIYLYDLFLTNTLLPFQKAHESETGLSNYYKLITTFFKTIFSGL